MEAASGHTRVTTVQGESVVQRHYAESLELLRIAESVAGQGEVLVDVGSGGGYPGLIIASVRPDTAVHLVEPLQKRARLLGEMASEMGLSNVRVHAVRGEEAGRGELREEADLVTARAVAALRELLEYTAPLAKPGGWLAFPKGSAVGEELAGAGNATQELGCIHRDTVSMRQAVSASLAVVLFERTGPMNPKYPRRPGMPGKRPL